PRALCSRPSTPGCHYSFFTAPPTTEIYTLSLHDALPISMKKLVLIAVMAAGTLAFQSCSSDDNGGGGSNPADTMVPTRLDYGAEGKEFYVYNDNNYLTKYTDTDGYTYDFTYGGGRLTKVVETYAGSNDRYEYTISYPAADKVKIIEKD